MAFFHGVKTTQVPTALLPPAQLSASLCVAFGCAPIHRVDAEQRAKVKPGGLALIFREDEAGQQLGISYKYDDFDKWGLSEVVYSHFALFGVGPLVMVNLFDPDIHFKSVTPETVTIAAGTGQLANTDVFPGTLELTPVGGGLAYIEGTDFAFNPITGLITLLDGGSMPTSGTVSAHYKYADPGMVTALDCIGGFDIITGITTGLSLIDQVFPRFRMVPGIIVAPGFSEDPSVAMIMAAKCSGINGVFQCVAFADIPSDGTGAVKRYTDVPAHKVNNNLVSEDLYLCWPKVKMGDRIMHMSVQAAGIMAQVDGDHDDIPYASPSNKNLQATASVVDGEEIWQDLQQANYLNANGIATGLNFVGGWKLWGNRTACYPDVTDPKDTWLPFRRMMAWYGNRLVLTWWQRVDWPITRRLVQTIVNSETINLNSMVAIGALLGGRIEFRDDENSVLDLMDGKITFHVFLGLPAPAEQIIFKLEYDPAYLQNLFS